MHFDHMGHTFEMDQDRSYFLNKAIPVVNRKELNNFKHLDLDGDVMIDSRIGHGSVEHGKEMSYNNYLDASSALETCDDFSGYFLKIPPDLSCHRRLRECSFG